MVSILMGFFFFSFFFLFVCFSFLLTGKASVRNIFCDIHTPKASYPTCVPNLSQGKQRNLTQKQANNFLLFGCTLVLTSQKGFMHQFTKNHDPLKSLSRILVICVFCHRCALMYVYDNQISPGHLKTLCCFRNPYNALAVQSAPLGFRDYAGLIIKTQILKSRDFLRTLPAALEI